MGEPEKDEFPPLTIKCPPEMDGASAALGKTPKRVSMHPDTRRA
jgi:hypothetical protein